MTGSVSITASQKPATKIIHNTGEKDKYEMYKDVLQIDLYFIWDRKIHHWPSASEMYCMCNYVVNLWG